MSQQTRERKRKKKKGRASSTGPQRFNGRHAVFVVRGPEERFRSLNPIVMPPDPIADFDTREATPENIREAHFLHEQARTKRTVIVKVKDALKFKPRLNPEDLCINLRENKLEVSPNFFWKVYSEYDDPSWHCWVCVCETDRAHKIVRELSEKEASTGVTDPSIVTLSTSGTETSTSSTSSTASAPVSEQETKGNVTEAGTEGLGKRTAREYEHSSDEEEEGDLDGDSEMTDEDEPIIQDDEEELAYLDETPEQRQQRLESEEAELQDQKDMIEYYAAIKNKLKVEQEAKTGQPFVPDPPRFRRGAVPSGTEGDTHSENTKGAPPPPPYMPTDSVTPTQSSNSAAAPSGDASAVTSSNSAPKTKLKLRPGTVTTLAKLKEIVGLPPVVIEDSEEFQLKPNDHICGCLVLQQFVHDSNYFQWGIPLHRCGPPDPVTGAFPDVAELSVFCAKGCGGKLLEAAVDFAAKHTPYRFIITASSHGAESWYASKGFRPVTALRLPMPTLAQRRAMTKQQRMQMAHLYRHRIPDAMIDITRDEPSLVMYISVPARVRQQQQLMQHQLRIARGLVSGRGRKGLRGKYARQTLKAIKLEMDNLVTNEAASEQQRQQQRQSSSEIKEHHTSSSLTATSAAPVATSGVPPLAGNTGFNLGVMSSQLSSAGVPPLQTNAPLTMGLGQPSIPPLTSSGYFSDVNHNSTGFSLPHVTSYQQPQDVYYSVNSTQAPSSFTLNAPSAQNQHLQYATSASNAPASNPQPEARPSSSSSHPSQSSYQSSLPVSYMFSVPPMSHSLHGTNYGRE